MAKLCPKCKSELEQLKACGAVNYFCNSCNELVSKSAVLETPEKAESNKPSDPINLEDAKRS